MYRVIIMEGNDEPWWFFDDWKEAIVDVLEFDNFYKALKAYKKEWLKLAESFDKYRSQDDLLAAFWTEKEQVWCDECVGYLQPYHSVALLDEWEPVPEEKKRWAYEKCHGENKPKCCNKEL